MKLRGFRVELGEIESVLMQCEGVLAAACRVREDVPGEQRLVGYVVPRDGAEVEEEPTRSYLRERLPAYMVPAVIEAVAAAQPSAWWPTALQSLVTHPSGRTWAGGARQSNYLCLFTLEGDK